MAKFNTVVNSFIAGEVSPKISGRSETVQFNQSCEELTNMLVQSEGGAFRRSGSELMFCESIGDYTYTSSGGMVLIPFSPSNGVKYAIVLCGAYISNWRIWTVGSTDAPTLMNVKGQVIDNGSTFSISDYRKTQYAQSGNTLVLTNSNHQPLKVVYNPTDGKITLMYLWDEVYNGAKTATITIASPGVVTVTAHGRANGERVIFKTTGALPTGITAGTPYYIKNVAANTFEIAATSGGTSINTTVSQSGTHTAYFMDNANTDIYQAWKRRAYRDPNIANIYGRGTVTPSASAVTAWTGTGTGVSLTFSESIVDSSWIGTYIKISDPAAGTKSGVFYVQERVSGTVLRGSVVSALPGTSAYGGIGAPATSWEEEAYKGYVLSFSDAFPAACSFYQQRLVLGGTQNSQNSLFFSRIGNVFEFMQIPLQQDSEYTGYSANNILPFSLNIASDEISKIIWISQNKLLTIGTDKREYACITEGVIGNATPPSIVAQTSYGSKQVRPVRKDGYVVFADPQSNLRDMQYNFNEDAWKSDEVSLMADHMKWKAYNEIDSDSLTAAASLIGIEFLALASPYDYVFASDSFGGVSCITIKKEGGVTAFSDIKLGGRGKDPIFLTYDMRPQVKSLLYDSGYLYLSVMRYDTGRSASYSTIERINLNPNIWASDLFPNYLGMRFLDACMSASSAAKTSWSTADVGLENLDRFNGETLRAFGDGFDLGDVVVTAGAVTIPYSVENLVLGYPYQSKLVTNYINPGSPIGSPQGILKKIDTIVVRFFKTIYAEVGNKLKTDPLVFRSTTVPGDTVTPSFTGDKVILPYAAIDMEGKVVVQSNAPYPMNVVSIAIRGALYD